jgi:hypothetical protein
MRRKAGHPLSFSAARRLVAAAIGLGAVAVGAAGTGDAGPVAQCPATPSFSFSHADPSGDIIAFDTNTRDILSVDVAGDSQTVCVTVTFAIVVDPELTDDYFAAQIGFDTDQNATTGMRFATFWIQPSYGPKIQCGDPGAIGAEAVFDLASGNLVQMGNPSVPWEVPIASESAVPVLYDGSSFTAVLPQSHIGGDANIKMEVMVSDDPFTYGPAEDCAPNWHSLELPSGDLLDPQDDDDDGRFDWLDNCPYVANFAQADGDSDWAGDKCDALGSGNIDCDSAIDSVDALKLLRLVAGLEITRNKPCFGVGPPIAGDYWTLGDVDCSHPFPSKVVNAVDALTILRVIASLPVTLPKGCPPIVGAPS